MALPSNRHLLLGIIAVCVSGLVSVIYLNPGLVRIAPWRRVGAGDAAAPPPTRPPPPRTNTLILTSWRSGSSFLGQVFNQHPDVFYLMEPIKHVWAAIPLASEPALRGAARDLLRSLYTCDETALDSYTEEPRRLSSVCWFSVSAALCRAPACPAATNASGGFSCERSCGAGPLAAMGRACAQSRHVVLKSVRVMDIGHLRPLVADPAVRLRVIHLVRDPRAVLASRNRLARINLQADNDIVLGRPGVDSPSLDVEVMRRICRSNDDIGALIADEIMAGRERGGGGLSGAYMAVRYEDLVSSPERTVREMFAFAGIELPAAVTQWVHLMTHGHKETSVAFDVGRMQSPAVARKWRWSMKFEEARSVQNACRAAMARYRYRVFENETQLRNASIDAFY